MQQNNTNQLNNKSLQADTTALDTVNYEDKFICIDNIDNTTDPRVPTNETVTNEHYSCIILVLQGTLNLKINGIDVRLKQGDYLNIMPYTKVEMSKSRCSFLSMKVEAYILHDVYETIGLGIGVTSNCFTFYHYHLTSRQANILKQDFLHIKSDMSNPAFRSLRSDLIKARLGVFLAHSTNIIEHLEPISHYDDTETSQLFLRFLDLLNAKYKEERSVQYYANSLGVQPKTLSATTMKYTGKTSSRVIDEYVTLRIKIVLYNNRHNIKEVSDMFNFASQSFFGRYFKRVSGFSPRKYISINSKKLSKQS